MNLPYLNHPECYQGFYLYDFGDHQAVGYTAEEIEVLQSTPQHRGGQAYRIHHASPEGRLALQGLSRLDSSVQEAMVFYRQSLERAREDYTALRQAALHCAPPCLVRWWLMKQASSPHPYVTVLLYAADHSLALGRWLQRIAFEGGDTLEAGVHIADQVMAAASDERVEELNIAPHPLYHSRPAGEVLASVHQAVQRHFDQP